MTTYQAGKVVVIEGVDEVLKKLNEITKELKAAPQVGKAFVNGGWVGAGENPNAELRVESKRIAQALVPLVVNAGARGMTAQSAGMARTARAKSDRIPRVVIGSVNPPWSSWGRGRSASARSAVAWGSNYGPKGDINYYQAPRNPAGYYAEPAVREAEGMAVEKFRSALARIARKYGAI